MIDRMIMFNMLLSGLPECLLMRSDAGRVLVDPGKLMELVDKILETQTNEVDVDRSKG